MKKCLLVFVVLLNAGIVFAQQTNRALHTQTIRFTFQNVVGDSVLQIGVIYNNPFGEPFSIRAFKYYISNIQLQYANSNTYNTKGTPHLVNEMDSTTKQLQFTAPAGGITGIQFLLGVDSSINTTGVQTGDLDPAKGMYWVWNTGYIMAKLEGTSATAKSPGHQFTYDIGGYKRGENAARIIRLQVSPTHQQDTLLSNTNIVIKADVLKWFTGAYDIKIGEHPMCHEPGILAMQIADNYKQLFSVSVK